LVQPPVVFQDGDKTYLGDGFHRRESYLKAVLERMLCEVRAGTVDDAILYANRGDTSRIARSPSGSTVRISSPAKSEWLSV
jgi:hypothetical protein